MVARQRSSHPSIAADASSSEAAASSNLFIPSSVEAIAVSFPQSNSEALSSSAESSVASRTVSSSGDAWVSSLSNTVLSTSNGAVACVPFNGVSSGSLFNGGLCDPFNGVPSLGEGETNDGADARLGLKSRGRLAF